LSKDPFLAYRKNDFENKEAMGKIIVGKSE